MDVVTPLNLQYNEEIEYLVGQNIWRIESKPKEIFDKEIIEFLSDLSISLLKNKVNKNYPDIIAFAYWIRKANLNLNKSNYKQYNNRLGRGIAFNIAPSNVPVNFAFSLAFSLLSGNISIIRTPSKKYPQTKIICEAINKLLITDKHKKMIDYIYIIEYEKNNQITEKISLISDIRIIWGSDKTISAIRKIETRPRTFDLIFSDRYSFCILDAKAILLESDKGLEDLSELFFNDVFLFDQNACSSPHLIYWLGSDEDIRLAKDKFWKTLNITYKKKIKDQPIINSLEKYKYLCKVAAELEEVKACIREDNNIYRLKINKLEKGIENHRGKYGFFFEFSHKNLLPLKDVINSKFQTLTYYGIEKENLYDFIIKNRLEGIDRIVPVGKALNMELIWDGYDIITSLSRIVSHSF